MRTRHHMLAALAAGAMGVGMVVAVAGQQFAPGWEELRGRLVVYVARIAALNLVSVGGTLRLLSGDDTHAEVLVADWPSAEVLSELGLTRSDSEPLWHIFRPIMEHLGIRYAWQRQDDAVRMTFERENAQ